MGNKHILIANADPPTLEEYGRALGKEWTVKLVASPNEALAEMAAHPSDVLVADCALPGANEGVELLDRVHAEYPKTIRILLAGELDKENRMADVEGSHLILTKPCDSETLKNAIERALSIDLWLTNDSLRELISRLRTFPIVPSLYLEVINALKSPHTTTAEVGAIIAKDMAMMTKLLQVTNSACFGLPRKISDPVEAVGILGFETVKSMVITLKLLSQYDKVKPVYFSIDRLWRHSTEVARISRRLAFTQQDDPVLAESAFTAGLMHDLGKLVLASNFDEQYSGAQALARRQQIPLWEVEKQIFGASHGEIGAYLLGLWGMPLDLVEAAALHHNPSRCLSKRFTPLTAVHVANALLYEAKPDKEGYVPAQVDEAYLADLGLDGRLQYWREMVLTPELEGPEARTRPGESGAAKKPAAASPKPAPKPAPKPVKPAPALPAVFSIPRQRWVYAGHPGRAVCSHFPPGHTSFLAPGAAAGSATGQEHGCKAARHRRRRHASCPRPGARGSSGQSRGGSPCGDRARGNPSRRAAASHGQGPGLCQFAIAIHLLFPKQPHRRHQRQAGAAARPASRGRDRRGHRPFLRHARI